SEDNQYHPFLDEGDYKVARWAIEQGPNQNALTDFLSIDEVSALHKLGLSYENARALHQKIDHKLPGVTPWRRSVIQISGINEEFKLFMRDPVKSIKELWANPAYLEHLTYAPEHRFADEGKSECIYDEFVHEW
ncbi:uncharacterized protein EDB91DRAFT_1063867, partial [Suillus paluster]|uniref:uncharacterized protein n=1 Tax=Suillus paluster TaxID=48578 RepID=UPI001B86E86D